MFTGIIRDIGSVVAITTETGDSRRVVIRTALHLHGTDGAATIGASMGCSGVCLTMTEINSAAATFSADISGETLACSTSAAWQVGTRLNLEPPLRMGEELGGHLVAGHVDSVGAVKEVHECADSLRLTVVIPAHLRRFIAVKGSVVIDGVSLTINDVVDNLLGVNIIPHTRSHTTLGDLRSGDKVNLEVDLLARYVARLLEQQ